MAKLKNTNTNKLLIMAASTVALAAIGKVSGRGDGNGTIFMIVGGILGFFLSPMVMAVAMEPKKV